VSTEQHNLTDYGRAVREFRLDVPERFNFARDVVGSWAQNPEKLAMLWLGPDGAERGIVELAADLRMSPSTAHRYALTLVEVGLLERCPRTRKYRLPQH